MAQTPEGKVKDKVKKLLKKYDCYYFMPVQAGYGAATLDFLVCCKGQFIGIETKAPGKKATERQQLTMNQMWEAGGMSLVVDGSEEHMQMLEGYLVGIDLMYHSRPDQFVEVIDD